MTEILQLLLKNQQVIFNAIHQLNQRYDEIAMNQGIGLAHQNEAKTSLDLRDYEFKVFSQWGEDGIIQHLIKSLDIKNKTFIEFGVGDFLESNCRFLLQKDNWQGFVIDGSEHNINSLKNSYFYWRYGIDSLAAFITRENINELLDKSGFEADVGILSVDIDGNDYHVLKAINSYSPRILICEYNAVFGPTRRISTPYEPEFYRTSKHYSNLYFGCSLGALTHLADKKGYTLVGTNSMASNAFFVRNDLMNARLQTLTAEQAFFPSHIRESRDKEGRLTLLGGQQRLELLRGLPIVNVESNTLELL